MTMHPKTKDLSTDVYVLLTDSKEVLYVGISVYTYERLRTHRRERPKMWSRVGLIAVERHVDRAAAEGREARLIERFRPPYNTARYEIRAELHVPQAPLWERLHLRDDLVPPRRQVAASA